MISTHTPSAQTSAAPGPADDPPPPVRAALASAIDVQALRVDQLSAAIVHATSQVTWSGRAAEKFRIRAAERSRECLQLALALRTSAERVNVAAMAPAPPAEYADQPLVPEWKRVGAGEADDVGCVTGGRPAGEPVTTTPSTPARPTTLARPTRQTPRSAASSTGPEPVL